VDTDLPDLPQEGCEVLGNGQPGQPIEDPNGPYFHNAVLAMISDGTDISEVENLYDHASVPDGALVNGEARVYFVNGADASLWTTPLEDTGSAEPITLNALSYPMGLADPDAVPIEGGVRLFFLERTQSTASICVAQSVDGVNFTMVGRALSLPEASNLTDPSVVPLGDGSWLMALSHGSQTRLARSSDGWSFTLDEGELNVGGVPELSVADGQLRLYTCQAGNIVSLTSSDAEDFVSEGTVVNAGDVGSPSVCDPSRIEGTDRFVFKTVDP